MAKILLERASSIFKHYRRKQFLRTQIPTDIVKLMGLTDQHKLVWKVYSIDGEIQVLVTKERKEDDDSIDEAIAHALDTTLTPPQS